MADCGLCGGRYHCHPLSSVVANVFDGGGTQLLADHGCCRHSLVISLLYCVPLDPDGYNDEDDNKDNKEDDNRMT